MFVAADAVNIEPCSNSGLRCSAAVRGRGMRVIFVQYLTVGVIKRGQTALLTLCGGGRSITPSEDCPPAELDITNPGHSYSPIMPHSFRLYTQSLSLT